MMPHDLELQKNLNMNSDAHPFHIEANGNLTLIVKPKPERFPR